MVKMVKIGIMVTMVIMVKMAKMVPKREDQIAFGQWDWLFRMYTKFIQVFFRLNLNIKYIACE